MSSGSVQKVWPRPQFRGHFAKYLQKTFALVVVVGGFSTAAYYQFVYKRIRDRCDRYTSQRNSQAIYEAMVKDGVFKNIRRDGSVVPLDADPDDEE